MSEEEYTARGIELLEKAVKSGVIGGFMESDGTIVRYDRQKQWYAVGHPAYGMWSFRVQKVSKYENRRKWVLQHGGKS